MTSWDLCRTLIGEPYGTYLVPGVCYGEEFDNHVRLGFGAETPKVQAGLASWRSSSARRAGGSPRSAGRGRAVIRFSLRRLILLIPVLVGITLVTFTLARVVPKNVAYVWAGAQGFRATPEAAAQLTRQYHLDAPLPVQYFHYMADLLRGRPRDLAGDHAAGDQRDQAVPAPHHRAGGERHAPVGAPGDADGRDLRGAPEHRGRSPESPHRAPRRLDAGVLAGAPAPAGLLLLAGPGCPTPAGA